MDESRTGKLAASRSRDQRWASIPIFPLRQRDGPLVAMLVAFVLLAFWARQQEVLPGDVRLTRWVQSLDWPALNTLTDATNWFMTSIPLTMAGLVGVLILSSRNKVEAAVLATAVVIRFVNGVLKQIVNSPRPTPDLVEVLDPAPGLGHPSGHSSGALLVIGAFAWILTRHEERAPVRWLIWTVAVAWIVLTGVGRVRIGVHWPSDVLSAWLWSLPVLVVIVRVASRFEQAQLLRDEQGEVREVEQQGSGTR